MRHRWRRRAEACCLALVTLLFWLDAFAQDGCTPIRFAPGDTSAVITGRAPAEGGICYSLTTLAGQTATLALLEGGNVMFGIAGLVEARDRHTFTTEHKTYHIRVSQLMRAVSDEPFRLRVHVTDADASERANARQQLRATQERLNALGYAAGPADGLMGPKTRRAIRTFQRDRGLPVTGRVDDALRHALRAAGAPRVNPEADTMPPSSATPAPAATSPTTSAAFDAPPELSCAQRPGAGQETTPRRGSAGPNASGTAVVYSDGPDLAHITADAKARLHSLGAGDDRIYVEGPQVTTQIVGGNGADTFLLCAIGAATTTLLVGPHDVAPDIVVLEPQVFQEAPTAKPVINVHGLNLANDRVLIRVPAGVEVSFGDDMFRTRLPIKVGSTTVNLFPDHQVASFEAGIADALRITTPDGRRIPPPTLGPSLATPLERRVRVGPAPRTLAGQAPIAPPGIGDCPARDEIPHPATALHSHHSLNGDHLASGEDDRTIVLAGTPMASHAEAGASDDRVYAYAPVSGTQFSVGAGADTVQLCTLAEDGLSLGISLGGSHRVDAEADTLMIDPAFFDAPPPGHRRHLHVFTFTPTNDRLVLRLPEGQEVAYGDTGTGSVRIEVGDVVLHLFRADDWLSTPFDWESVIVAPTHYASAPAAPRPVAEATPEAPAVTWRWGNPHTYSGAPAEMATLPMDCRTMQDPTAVSGLARMRDDVSPEYQAGASLDNDNWAFYSHDDDLVRLGAAETRYTLTVKAGRGDDTLYLVGVDAPLTVHGDGGADTFVLCSMQGSEIELSLPTDRFPDRVILAPAVFRGIPTGIDRHILLEGFVSANDRLELRVPADLEVAATLSRGKESVTVRVGEVTVRTGPPFPGGDGPTFDTDSIVIVPGEAQ